MYGQTVDEREDFVMMTPEQYAEIQAKSQPLLERLVEVLNELSKLGAVQGEIVTVGGSVVYRSYDGKWEIEAQR